MARKLIGEFLVELSENPELFTRYKSDQKGVLARDSGLTADQQEIVGSNDLKRIRDAIREEYKKAEVFVVPLPVQHIAASNPDY